MVSVCKRCLVDGRVQGVFYRTSARSKAVELGLTGWVRNLQDGRVEVLMKGSGGQVEDMIDWLWQGSSISQVVSVQCTEEQADDLDGFTVKF